MIFPKISFLFFLIAPAICFQPGVKYTYRYENSVRLIPNAEVKDEKESLQFQLQSKLQATVIWANPKSNEELIKVELHQPALLLPKKETLTKQSSRLDSSSIYFHNSNGHIIKIFRNSHSDTASRHVLNGIANLLSRPTKQLLKELDDGCKISLSQAGAVEKLEKECIYHISHKKTQHIRSAALKRKVHMEYQFTSTEDDFQVLDVTEHLQMSSNLWKTDAFSLQSQIHLEFENKVAGTTVFEADDIVAAIKSVKLTEKVDLVEVNAKSSEEKTSNEKCNLASSIKSLKKGLKTENLSKQLSANTFSKLLKCFRAASKKDIESVLKLKEFSYFLPQLLDIVAFAGTDDAVDAAFAVLDFSKTDDALLERYLVGLSTVIVSTEKMVFAVLNQLEKITGKERTRVRNEVLATLTNSLGALTKKLPDDSSEQVIKSVEKYFQSTIESCKTDDCLLMNLRGLRNAALPSTTPLLLGILGKSGKIAHEALLALKAIGFHRLSPLCESFAKRIYYQLDKIEDTSNRVVAAEMLMDCYTSKSTLHRLLASLADQKEHEMATLITSIITQKMNGDMKFRADVQNALRDPDVKQYYAVAQRGNSVSFSNPLMAFLASSDSNSTYNVHVELLSAGVMKKCFVDIWVNSVDGSVPVLSIGAATEGLESVVSGSSSDEPPSAAIDLSISGVLLRPKVLFSGTTNLMGLVFSGAGSEKTPILQGNYLILEVSEEVVLLGGLPVKLELEGVLSNDLSGSIQISLWSRNSQSEIIDSVAMMLKASVMVNTGFVSLKDELSVRTEASIEILSHSEFYEEPYKMCVQLMHPDVLLRSQRKLSLSVPGHSVLRRKLKKKKWTFSSRSYFLNKKNNDMCAAMAAAA